MSSPIYMPKLGLTMTEGTLTEWLVNTGETVSQGQPVASIETDKIETEIEAEAEGHLHHLCKSGEVFECGVVLGWVLEEGEEPPETPETPEVANDQTTAIEQNEILEKETKTKSSRIAASPAAKRLAKEKGVDLSTISGSGPSGRIVVEDVEAFSASTPVDSISETLDTNASQAAVSEAQKLGVDLSKVQTSSTDRKIRKSDVQAHIKNSSESASEKQSFLFEPIGEGERTQLTGMRKVIANRMHSSLQSMAQLTLHLDVEMDNVISLRREMQSDDELPGYTDFVIASVARALKAHPQLNSQMLENEILQLNEINIGMAVALSDGLVVPVVRNADQLSLNEIAKNTSRLAGQARDGKLALEDLEGGTFSVSSLGMFGVDGFTPVINPPNAAILGVGRIREDTAWDDQTPRKTSRMVISLTWDHRVLDGAPAADFASTIKSGLENPESLLNVN
ncbi:MAG: dihydrolipoamide acetyltransferase family protein [Acidimicrobiales bacterium]|jgi:pyruvate dehydrogenase E2 component (dihydrolipoamide acetyltransferase)|nr:dihydrolipoamide acetyltransferase [Acidimicrobiaceae bacterium]MDP6161188.1 dihydrolipoamide acetyltransferase family protein [Acidimicrobiales bacterium]MDP6285251.1 dihydrolipoamide acetyltransferase family protein [Acidimicrobiales bacterium]HJL91309.1 dihydrolipoamide acetyltransferase family protein [Acidimicrobiales bacterium]HJO40922.1 dihydrolipoamide acetyltransferase family protein [Acidimicrobiales bacterium]|tara:strand:- start:19489 stop:20844 length:1356 start_codon:yes stop_codon:yes gene_type:complete